eukprot:scaffold14670_cov108-Isochrysis_galbana.AAC.2
MRGVCGQRARARLLRTGTCCRTSLLRRFWRWPRYGLSVLHRPPVPPTAATGDAPSGWARPSAV